MKKGKERTFVLVKPDGVARGLAGEILSRFERKGLSIVAARMVVADQKLAEEHYAEHKYNDEYFGMMTQAILTGPCLAVVLEGELAIQAARQLIGTANPFQSSVGTIRGDFALKMGENLIHGADSPSAAEREIGLWFSDKSVTAKVEEPYVMPATASKGAGWGPPKKVTKPTPLPTPQKFVAPSDEELDAWTPDFLELEDKLGEPQIAWGVAAPVGPPLVPPFKPDGTNLGGLIYGDGGKQVYTMNKVDFDKFYSNFTTTDFVQLKDPNAIGKITNVT